MRRAGVESIAFISDDSVLCQVGQFGVQGSIAVIADDIAVCSASLDVGVGARVQCHLRVDVPSQAVQQRAEWRSLLLGWAYLELSGRVLCASIIAQVKANYSLYIE